MVTSDRHRALRPPAAARSPRRARAGTRSSPAPVTAGPGDAPLVVEPVRDLIGVHAVPHRSEGEPRRGQHPLGGAVRAGVVEPRVLARGDEREVDDMADTALARDLDEPLVEGEPLGWRRGDRDHEHPVARLERPRERSRVGIVRDRHLAGQIGGTSRVTHEHPERDAEPRELRRDDAADGTGDSTHDDHGPTVPAVSAGTPAGGAGGFGCRGRRENDPSPRIRRCPSSERKHTMTPRGRLRLLSPAIGDDDRLDFPRPGDRVTRAVTGPGCVTERRPGPATLHPKCIRTDAFRLSIVPASGTLLS